ncbi:hypothetical protein BU17DRAFT_35995 [Hysterangium stoloniferum]|nr:hypothetical protein BU17DRAFT_35995 [Hysterangium stoloniferum]
MGAFPQLDSAPDPQKKYGFLELVPGDDPLVDIIAIHGLNGHYIRTWEHESGVMWLKDLLPKDISRARVLTYGYDADINPQKSYQTIHDHAETFLAKLVNWRKETKTSRPIIFIVHDLGGIILIIGLGQADAANATHLIDHKSIVLSTYGIISLGTPYQGINTRPRYRADASFLGRLWDWIHSYFVSTPNAPLVKEVKPNSPTLQEALSRYKAISQQFRTIFYYENHAVILSGSSEIILVERASAAIPGQLDCQTIGLNKDHHGMAKFKSDEDDDFQTTYLSLKRMSSDARSTVVVKWKLYKAYMGLVLQCLYCWCGILCHTCRVQVCNYFCRPHRRPPPFLK